MILKIVVFMAVITSSVIAWAEPADSQGIDKLDPGSSLTIQQNINIPAGEFGILTNGKALQQDADKNFHAPTCRVSVADAQGRAVRQDSEISAGTTLTLISAETDAEAKGSWGFECSQDLKFASPSGNLISLSCDKQEGGKDIEGPYDVNNCINIGEFRKLLVNLATLRLAPPKTF
jgi:hypothetical protein